LIDYHAVAKLDCVAAILFEMEQAHPLQKGIFFLELLDRRIASVHFQQRIQQQVVRKEAEQKDKHRKDYAHSGVFG